MNIADSGTNCSGIGSGSLGDDVMIYLVSMLGVLALMSGTAAVIFITLRDHADAIVAALAGRSMRAAAMSLPAPRVRVTVRPPVRRQLSMQLRAAA